MRVQEPFNPIRVSPSRVEALNSCGVAFKMKYLDGLPPTRSGSAALRGTVVHRALEQWTPNREADLLTLMRSAWLHVTEGTVVKDFIAEYQGLSAPALRQEQKIRDAWAAKGKESKAPRMTRDWKESEVAKKINRLLGKWIPLLNEGSPWLFTERDPLPGIYDETLVIARRYQAKYGHLPSSLYTEFAFTVEWRGFLLNGHIDCIETLIHPETGELQGLGVLDYKTYAKEPAAQKDWRQKVFYDVAIRDLVSRGQLTLPFDLDSTRLLVGIDYVRLLTRDYAEMSAPDHDRLERELRAYLGIVEGGHFLPAEKGKNPDFCDYPENCCLTTTSVAGGCAKPVEVVL